VSRLEARLGVELIHRSRTPGTRGDQCG
jgi:DNA-binding transcriptional LysR family regulator